MKTLIAATLGCGLFTLGGLVVPAAAAPTGADYGQHVRTCTQTMGFTGEHNPGMHRGFSGWSPHHHC